MNKANACESNHGEHETLDIELYLTGDHHGIKDIPGIPEQLSLPKFNIRVFNFKKYRNSEGYCPGDCRISQSIYTHGVWEGFNTLIFLDILSKGNPDNDGIIDIGASIGWYSMLGLLNGYRVKSIECDRDVLKLLRYNLASTGGKFEIIPIELNENAELATTNDEMEFFKCDIEGSEQYAYQMYRRYFEEGVIRYAMLEISPCFNDSYFELVPKIIANGYTAYLVPGKGFEHNEAFKQGPLETLKKHCKIETNNWTEYIKSFSQEDFIFIRNDLI